MGLQQVCSGVRSFYSANETWRADGQERTDQVARLVEGFQGNIYLYIMTISLKYILLYICGNLRGGTYKTRPGETK